MFNCRPLDGAVNVLRTDYRINCNSPEHGPYEVIAAIVIALFSFGIPLYLAAAMLCLKRVGIEDAGPGAGASARSPQRASTLSRLGSKLASTVSSSSGGAKAWEGDGADGGLAIQFGGGDGGGGGGGGGLYLASS
eukprot:COSAG04_NODE_7002_length_1211_cov_2.312950_2_plen_135_part_00